MRRKRGHVGLLPLLMLLLWGCSDEEAKKGAVNDPCTSNTDCADKICHRGYCASANPAGKGASCKGPGDCLSFNCSNGVCAPGTSLGGTCLHGEECASGKCLNNVCQAVDPDGGLDGAMIPDKGFDILTADHAAPDRATPDTLAPDQAAPDQAAPDTLAPDQTMQDQTMPDQTMPDQTVPDQALPDTQSPDGGCSAAVHCDDKLICTTDTCSDGGGCVHQIKSNWCLIGGKCIGTQTIDPSNDCKLCQPSKSTSGWSPMTDGTKCDDSVPCTHTDVCTSGTCGGTVYFCNDTLSCTTDFCNGDKTCKVQLKPAKCIISGKCYDKDQLKGAAAPDNCLVCDPSFSTSAWSVAKGCVGTLAKVLNPDELDVDGVGTVWVGGGLSGFSSGGAIYTITRDGVVTTHASAKSCAACSSSTSSSWGPPRGLAVDSAGNVFFAGACCPAIKAIFSGSTSVSKYTANGMGLANGALGAAVFRFPRGLGAAGGAIYIADTGNSVIRKIFAGKASTVAGTTKGFSNGDATKTAKFSSPWGVTADSAGKIYIADTNNHAIRMVNNGKVVTLAGTGGMGHKNGAGSAALFNYPVDLAVDSSGKIYVADRNNHRIRLVQYVGGKWTVSTMAGTGGTSSVVNGKKGLATFKLPTGVAVDTQGRIYVADSGNDLVRVIRP